MVEAISNYTLSIEEDYSYNEFWNETEMSMVAHKTTKEKEILEKISLHANKLISELSMVDIYTFSQNKFEETVQELLNLIMLCLGRHKDTLSEEAKKNLQEIKALALFTQENLGSLDLICKQARQISDEMDKPYPDLEKLLQLAKDFLEDFNFFYKKVISNSWISDEMMKDVKTFHKETKNDIKELIRHLESILDL